MLEQNLKEKEEKTKDLEECAILVKSLYKTYDSFSALKNVSFSVKKGEIVGFLGPNGAGKTTTMNILTGCISYNSGVVKIFGIDVFDEPLKAKKNIGYLPENPPLYNSMTVYEYLKFVCEMKKVLNFKEEIERVSKLCGILDKKNKLISSLSKGYKQRVGIAQALIGSPKVLILDEPTSGLDPAQIVQVRNLIKSLAKQHTIILSTHILSEIQAVCSRIMVISAGEIVADDSEENLLKQKEDSYFLRVFCSSEEKVKDSLKELSSFLVIENLKVVSLKIIEFKAKTLKEIEDVELLISKTLMQFNIPILKFTKSFLTLEQVFIKKKKKKGEGVL